MNWDEDLLVYEGYVIATTKSFTGWGADIRRADEPVGRVLAFCETRDEATHLAKEMVDDHKERHGG